MSTEEKCIFQVFEGFFLAIFEDIPLKDLAETAKAIKVQIKLLKTNQKKRINKLVMIWNFFLILY